MDKIQIAKLLYSIFGDNATDTILKMLDDEQLDKFLNTIL